MAEPGRSRDSGIQHGDIVKIYNERGIVLGGAYVNERHARRGLHGPRREVDTHHPWEVDRGGAINTITPRKITSKTPPAWW